MEERKKLWILLILSIVVVSLLSFFYKPIRQYFMGKEIIAETYTGKNKLQSEEWFERQYQEIEKQKANLEITKEDLKNNSNESLKNSYIAEKKILNGLIAEYNSKMNSSKYNEFANRGLPRQIEPIK